MSPPLHCIAALIISAPSIAFKVDLIASRDAYSAELMRIEAGGSAAPHTDAQNHAFYLLEGSGEVTIGKPPGSLAPGSMCVIPSGAKHSLRSFGPGPLVMLVIYDPPRSRST
jgi:mannose-6-phosphate isomerase-like protein (cupin superfamily)